jgi:hypothetical protein
MQAGPRSLKLRQRGACPTGHPALPGFSCPEFLQQSQRAMSPVRTGQAHATLLYALNELYDIFLECACPLRDFFGMLRQAMPRWGGGEGSFGRGGNFTTASAVDSLPKRLTGLLWVPRPCLRNVSAFFVTATSQAGQPDWRKSTACSWGSALISPYSRVSSPESSERWQSGLGGRCGSSRDSLDFRM